MPTRSYEDIIRPYQNGGIEDSGINHVNFLMIYLSICFAPESNPLVTTGERFDPDQMKQGLAYLDSELENPNSWVRVIEGGTILTWITQVWNYIRNHEPNHTALITPLVNLLNRTAFPLLGRDEPYNLSGLVERPDESIALLDIYRISQNQSALLRYGSANWIPRFVLELSFSKFVYVTLLQLLSDKFNNGQYYTYTTVRKDNAVLQKLIFDNSDLFKPYEQLIAFLQTKSDSWVDRWPLLLEFSSPNDYMWIERLWSDFDKFKQQLFWFWRQGPSYNGELFTYEEFYPGRITKTNLIAIYAVGAAFVKFEPTLYLYLFPQDSAVVGEFWNQYGESIVLLQELYDAYQDWSDTLKNVDSSFEHNQKLSSFLSSSQICNRLATRMVDETTFDRLRSQLVDLAENAVVQGVPLKLLFKNMPIDSPDELANAPKLFATVIKNKSFTSSVWYFDYLRTWWDGICKSTLEKRLKELIVESIPSELKQQDYQADQLLLDSLRQIAMYGSRSAGSQVRHNIRHAKLSRDTRRSLLDLINKITNSESAISQLRALGIAVQTGTMSQGIADMELSDFVDRWRNVFLDKSYINS